MPEALTIVFQPEHLRKTVRIALIVGCVLTTINQVDVFVNGHATTTTFIKTALNFCVPFVVSNLGLLAGKKTENDASAAAGVAVRTESGVLWYPDPEQAGSYPPAVSDLGAPVRGHRGASREE